MKSVINVVKTSISLLPQSDAKKIYIILAVQSLFGFLDLVGVFLIGVIAALTVSEVSGGVVGDRTSQLLTTLGVEDSSAQEQVIILGVVAVTFLASKSLLSMYFNKRYLLFLGRSAGRLSGNLISLYFREGLSKVQTRTVHETIYLLTDGVNSIAKGMIGSTMLLISDVSLLLVLSAGIFFVDPVMALSTLILFTLVGFGLHNYTAKKVHSLAVATRKLSIQGSERLAELQFAFKEVYTRNQRGYYIDSLSKNRMLLGETAARQTFLQGFSKYFFELTFVVGAFVIAAYQFFSSPAGRAVTILGIFFAASGRIMPAVLRIQAALINIRGHMGSAEPTLELIAQLNSSKETSDGTAPSFSTDSDFFVGRVSAERVTFQYPNSEELNLNEVNFEANQGEFVAIVGPSGAGKSTLVDVLLGLRDPTRGQVSISGLSPRQAIEKWGGSVAYIPQNSMIFPGSIKRNIGLGFPEDLIDSSKCWEALKVANLEEFVFSLPRQLDEEVGEMGIRLSGGQRQRLGIARALYTNPKIIFFDEATSALDAITEAEISKSIMGLKRNKTIITIAHRLSTVVEADKIYMLSEGRILGVGSFEVLRSTIPEFSAQVNLMGL